MSGIIEEQVMPNRVAWENGLIGKGEAILTCRYTIPPLWARGIITVINSLGLRNLMFKDMMGPVRPNVWFAYIASSGAGNKTPPLRLIEDEILMNYNKELIAPSKFTPPGFTEWAQGTDGKEDGKQKRKAIPPHPHGIIIRDEASRLLGENKNSPYTVEMKEFLSELYDGKIEGNYTRQYQHEGNIRVFVSLAMASSPYFYDLLEDTFFTQGTGNRILWNTEIKQEPTKEDPHKFFFSSGCADEAWDRFKIDTIENLRSLEQIKEIGNIEQAARVLWVDYQYECRCIAAKRPKRDAYASYITKQPLNALKLAMNYAASVNSVDDSNLLWILKEDMERAVNDTKAYTENWKQVLAEWKEWIEESKRKRLQKPLEERKYELTKFVKFGMTFKDKLFCITDIVKEENLRDRTAIGEILSIGVDKGWLEVYGGVKDPYKLTPEQTKRFKPRGGIMPTIYRITMLGEKECT